MAVNQTAPARELRAKVFPWRRRGVLLPVDDRRTAALGLCMYTASAPRAVAAQSAFYWMVRAVGGRALPGREEQWTVPFSRDTWATLIEDWRASVGTFEAMAVYQRRQSERDGLTLLLTRSGSGIAVVKVRSDGALLRREQEALTAVAGVNPDSFRAPAALGSGSVADDVHWSAQTSVFERPHRPVLEAPVPLFDEVSDCLGRVPGHHHHGATPAHNDLTPWNLRRDHRGRIWLYDWEDWGAAPAGSDRVYFHAAASALTGRPMPTGMPGPAIERWRAVVLARQSNTKADIALNVGILSALDQALANTLEMDSE